MLREASKRVAMTRKSLSDLWQSVDPSLITSACLVAVVGSLALLPSMSSAVEARAVPSKADAQVSGNIGQANPCPSVKYVMGRDSPWVPTPDALVELMLDLVELTPQDYVIDLGSGDGRMLIAAARRGASGHGIEFNPTMVECANLRASQAGVTDKVRFIQGDMFEADISKATVMPLFLLEENLAQLTPSFLKLAPGTRIATNDYEIPGWGHDREVKREPGCVHWCRAMLWIVPAQVEGTWIIDQRGEVVLDQIYQELRGVFRQGREDVPVTGRLRGNDITLKIDQVDYKGTVSKNTISLEGPDGTTLVMQQKVQ